MKGELANAAFIGKTVGGKRPLDGLDDLVARAKLVQGDHGSGGDEPPSWLELGGKTVSLQLRDLRGKFRFQWLAES